MIILVLTIFYRQSAIIPILHYNMIISEEAAFLIKAGLTGLMIISAAKRRFHCYMTHSLRSSSMVMSTDRGYQDL